ncbi:mitochondrial GTPase 1 [Anopheles nili]|uniref:mitochondrial GTPase 1 n=1 Tax=Anopheles nili TaxID=185578 RepID=UPI00237B2DCA|nr:mitochondrial GTPase 1 [Anopheles nili]
MHFRTKFPLVSCDLLNWFPGHMNKGMKQIQQKLNQIDCIIEVHDARIPLTGRNADFQHNVLGIKPHILVFNKSDLIEKRYENKIIDSLRHDSYGEQHILFTSCKKKNCKGLKRMLPLAQSLINNSGRFNRTAQKDFCIMIIGIPNVGKSSLINVLRNQNLSKKGATPVGAIAGVTRTVLNRIKICEEPSIYLLDTPGILLPNINDIEMGLRLALVASLHDHLVGEELIADYLLYLLNKQRNYRYVDVMGLQKPTDSIAATLIDNAVIFDKMIQTRLFNGTVVARPDVKTAAKYMLKCFRTGKLGKVLLDLDKITN